MSENEQTMSGQGNPFGNVKMFPHSPWYPYDPSAQIYCFTGTPFAEVYERAGWLEENMSWKESCYIFAGLYVTPTGYLA
jgi:hypothetical protein